MKQKTLSVRSALRKNKTWIVPVVSGLAMLLIFVLVRHFSILEQGHSTGAEFVTPFFVPLFFVVKDTVRDYVDTIRALPDEDETEERGAV